MDKTKAEKAEYMRQWRAKNRAHLNAYSNAYNQRPDRKAKNKITQREKYIQNKEKILAYSKEYSKRPDRVARRKSLQNARRRTLEGWCRKKALGLQSKSRSLGIECNVDYLDLLSAMPKDMICPALKIRMTIGEHGKSGASVDKLDPELGYVKGNIAIISKLANNIKSTANSKQIAQVARWLKALGR